MASRKIAELLPELQKLYALFESKMKAVGIDYIVTCTYRTQEEQDQLYAIGRTKPGNKVTWTKHSKHTLREAFDIAILKNGKIVWNDMNLYKKAGKIGESVGLIWGGSFGDMSHFQLGK